MTTNEQIMIDGVDVLYICKYGQTGLPICVDLEHRYCKLKSTNSKKCNLRPVVEYSDYEKLYKQLQRKTAECEDLRERLQVLDEEAITYEITEDEFEEFQNLKKKLRITTEALTNILAWEQDCATPHYYTQNLLMEALEQIESEK